MSESGSDHEILFPNAELLGASPSCSLSNGIEKHVETAPRFLLLTGVKHEVFLPTLFFNDLIP